MFDLVGEHGKLGEAVACRLFSHLVAGMEYLHANNFAHRDLKPENCLLTHDLRLKIADFGLCHSVTTEALLSTQCGSIYYAAPEVIRGEDYDGKAADVWSMGVILYSMLCGTLTWTSTNRTVVIEPIISAQFSIPGFLPRPRRELLARMLDRDPQARHTVAEIARDPWIEGEYSMVICQPPKAPFPRALPTMLSKFVAPERRKSVFSGPGIVYRLPVPNLPLSRLPARKSVDETKRPRASWPAPPAFSIRHVV
jgi:serine/threonine protein kinase